MELNWTKPFDQNHQLWWHDKGIRCAEISTLGSDWRWCVVLSYRVAPMDFVQERTGFYSLEEAKEYTENLVRLLIIGGHHEHT